MDRKSFKVAIDTIKMLAPFLFFKNKKKEKSFDLLDSFEEINKAWDLCLKINIIDEDSALKFRKESEIVLYSWIEKIKKMNWNLNANGIVRANSFSLKSNEESDVKKSTNFYVRFSETFAKWLEQDAKSVILIEGNKSIPVNDEEKKSFFEEHRSFFKIINEVCDVYYKRSREKKSLIKYIFVNNQDDINNDYVELLIDKDYRKAFLKQEKSGLKDDVFYDLREKSIQGNKVLRTDFCSVNKEAWIDFKKNLAVALQEQRQHVIGFDVDLVNFYEALEMKKEFFVSENGNEIDEKDSKKRNSIKKSFRF